MQQQQESGGEESWLEEQCHSEINGQNDEYEREFVRERDNNLSTVWGAFQDSATAVAQLYRGKLRLKLQLRKSSSLSYLSHLSIHRFILFMAQVCVCVCVHSVCVCVCLKIVWARVLIARVLLAWLGLTDSNNNNHTCTQQARLLSSRLVCVYAHTWVLEYVKTYTHTHTQYS